MSRVSRASTPMVLASILVLVLCGSGTAQARRSKAKFEPPSGKAMVLIGCDWSDNFKQYKNLTGDTPAGGVFWYEFNGDTSFFWHNARNNVGPDGVLAIHFWFADHGTVADIVSGRRDENIKKIGEAFKEWGHPLFVAVGPEFDHKNNIGKYTPAEFVTIFRRVHRIWDEMGLTNVAYVWHSCVENLGEQTWAYYPGEKYVDWFGMSLYWPAQFRDAPTFTSAARRRKKPVVVMESSSINGKTSSFDDWHGPYLRACSAMGVKVICYNNFRDHPQIAEPFKHSAFDQLPRPIADAWGRAMKSPAYLHASPELQELLEGRKKAVTQELPQPEVVQPAKGRPINLLPKIDPKRDVIEGDWRPANKVLDFSGDKEWSRVQIPYKPSEEYDLTVVAERVQGTEILVIGLVVGGRQAMILLDGWGGGVSGLELIDGKPSQDNETTHRRWRFTNGRPTTIVCKVRRDGVFLTCDGEQIVNWRGDPSRLSIVGGWKVPDENPLFLGGWKGGAFRFRKLEVREVAVSDGEQGR